MLAVVSSEAQPGRELALLPQLGSWGGLLTAALGQRAVELRVSVSCCLLTGDHPPFLCPWPSQHFLLPSRGERVFKQDRLQSYVTLSQK